MSSKANHQRRSHRSHRSNSVYAKNRSTRAYNIAPERGEWLNPIKRAFARVFHAERKKEST